MASLLCASTALSMSDCGQTATSTAESEASTAQTTEASQIAGGAVTVADNDEDIYFNNFGDFYDAYDAYEQAMDADTVSERYALLAIAEAKSLESAVGTPMYGPTADYCISTLGFSTSCRI